MNLLGLPKDGLKKKLPNILTYIWLIYMCCIPNCTTITGT